MKEEKSLILFGIKTLFIKFSFEFFHHFLRVVLDKKIEEEYGSAVWKM